MALNNCTAVREHEWSNEALESSALAIDSGGGGFFEKHASQLMRARLLERTHCHCCLPRAYGSLLRVITKHLLLVTAVFTWVDLPSGSFVDAAEPFATDTASSRETQVDATRRISMQQLNREAQSLVNDVVDKPSFFRRMPTQNIDCDPQMFQHLVRYPEVLVNIWDVMGITKVQVNRTGPYTFTADDGMGTTCKCDLVFGSEKVHIYYGTGAYKGNMAPRQITGRCVCVLYSSTAQSPSGRPMINGSMDVFLKLDNFGADLLTRTLSPLVGKTADYNFVESAKFLAQISQVCERNPGGAQILASKLTKVQPPIRDEFARIAHRIGSEAVNSSYLPQLASMGPDGTKLTSKSAREAGPLPQPTRETFSDSTIDPNNQLNLQRVPPMTLSDSSSSSDSLPYATGTAVQSGTSFARPTSIAPAKANIYMRR